MRPPACGTARVGRRLLLLGAPDGAVVALRDNTCKYSSIPTAVRGVDSSIPTHHPLGRGRVGYVRAPPRPREVAWMRASVFVVSSWWRARNYISAHVSAGVARAVCERAGNPPRAARSQTRAELWRGTTRLVAGGRARACGPRAGRHHSSHWSPACRHRVVSGDGRGADDLNAQWQTLMYKILGERRGPQDGLSEDAPVLEY